VLGFNARYTVGVWLGNVDQSPMDGVTGSLGPALVLRGIFANLLYKILCRHSI
jgi:penicillin-binding protein 1C